ncbi:MAG: hypothetical protein AB3N28_12050 [Kordiimonas sp.]
MNNIEIADLICRFVHGEADGEEWNDFLIANDLGNEQLNQLQRVLADVWIDFPADKKGHYTSACGLRFMLALAELVVRDDWGMADLEEVEVRFKGRVESS